MAAAPGNPFGDVHDAAAAPAPAAAKPSAAPGDPFAAAPRAAPGNPFGAPVGGSAPTSAVAVAASPATRDSAPPRAASPVHDGTVFDTKIGELDKQGEPKRIMGVAAGKPGWKRRWVHIGKMKLTYHASEEDAETRAKPIKNNYVQLTGYAVVPVDDAAACGPGCFELLPTLPHLDRVWVFKAPGGPPEREVWLRAFERGGCLRAGDPRSAEAIAKRAAASSKA